MTTAEESMLRANAIGTPLTRLDGTEKVTGTAPYAVEHPVDSPAHLHPLQAAIALGRATGIDTSAAEAEPGVLAVLTHANAPRLASTGNGELEILQSGEVGYRGQFLGGVIAETPEIARRAADLIRVHYERYEHDVELRADRDDLYKPEQVNPAFDTDTAQGDADGALASAAVTLDATYSTPMEHNNPMEPHATIACWTDGELTLHDSTQGVYWTQAAVAPLFELDQQQVRVISPHVGGGFGSKGIPHPNVVLAAMAARLVPGRPVKFPLTRQQMFSVVGYRTPTIQHVRLGADEQGRLSAITLDVVEQTAKVKEFAEQTAIPTRTMYAAPHRRTSHRLAALDTPVPTWMRAPGECPGMFGPEVAMDEMALACGLDPIEFRVRNEPETDPESGLPFSSRNLVACLREGARRFGWHDRDPRPGTRRHGEWLVGTGVAASTYPVFAMPGSQATIRATPDGRYAVRIGAVDIGTGTWTALTQIAADALEVSVGEVDLEIGSTTLPTASGAGGSSGINSWGSPIVAAARTLRARLDEHGGTVPAEGVEATEGMPDNPHTSQYAMHSFGAQFAEVWVNADTGEVSVPRLLGIFAAGRIINARTGRSQLLGGMTMGLSMALHEESVLDPRFGHVVNHDLAEYHIATNADVGSLEVDWLDEHDPYVNPMGSKGIGELGITGTAAAITNAAYHATGIRVRELPLHPDKFLR
ncbi:xanthine dehydrogenase molybdenum binding subunit apoprotein [Halopolyspora algeriensis]|uniref:Xanthine dehydrogenase molybdenum binding subunit apoprotein n=1 Tax=Halopolyspora algeriensis TaxID=1500506 RepID=A0A368VWI1_9ACTN|nr:xanthine dehydrogenase family protein molybdopterin-binding subunit [Halopolyspora algeriensis]RCW46209.1 xanthine dehydrogenase molybdenum binding subunit apoprotein [Halopolyspora algeriensis]TQM55612.1 xanthine dehydrogenase molybdenum binding subunit apoprotein [Halopolyspora algeriensis]